jgi:hydrogenase maturation protease
MKEFLESGERSLAEPLDFVHPPTLVIGLGNPILGDDGVGWRVAERVKMSLSEQLEGMAISEASSNLPGNFLVEVDCLSLGGLSLMERLISYDRAILIDAITTHQKPAGHVACFPLDDLPKQVVGHLSSAHDTTLQTAIEVGRSLGARLPEQIMIVAIESQISYNFSELLSPEVEAAVPQAEKIVLQLLTEWAETPADC